MVYQGRYRKLNRLREYDYSQAGWYFVTICTKNRECLFGEVKDGKMVLNGLGEIAYQIWAGIPAYYSNVTLDEFVVMPNHVHGIIVIKDNIIHKNVGTEYYSVPTGGKRKYGLLSKIVKSFKHIVTRQSRQNDGPYVIWQRSYYDHVIRIESSLHKIRQYIAVNPPKWKHDRNNPANLWM